LWNPGFLSNAAPELIEHKKQKMEEAKQKISTLELQLSKLKSS
jgi:valyl-tRNA synthetase